VKAEKIVSDLVKPFGLSGAYKNEAVALKDIIVTHIDRKIEIYNKAIRALAEKYGKDFEIFTKDYKNKATPELEDDWMEWKGAIEMRKAWDEALKEVMENAAEV